MYLGGGDSMYRMMIVDDQMKEVEGITELIDWNSLDIEIVGYANNGKEGVEKSKELNPDIIITDVIMPIMDGIEMIRQIKNYKPDVKVIFISCFDDFKFVSKAIEQGIYAYVLKPILPSEFIGTVNKVLGICEQETEKAIELMNLRKKVKESRELLIDQFFKNLLFGVFDNSESIYMQAEFLELDLEKLKNIRVAYFEIKSKVNENKYYDIISIIERLREQYKQYHFVLTDLEHIAVVLTNVTDNTHEIGLILKDMVEVKLYVGVSNAEREIEKANRCFMEAKSAIEYKFYTGADKIIYTNYVNLNSVPNELDFLNINNEIKKLLFSGEKSNTANFLGSIFTENESADELKYKSFTIINSIHFHLATIKFDMEKFLGKYSQIIDDIYNLHRICKSAEQSSKF